MKVIALHREDRYKIENAQQDTRDAEAVWARERAREREVWQEIVARLTGNKSESPTYWKMDDTKRFLVRSY